MDDPRKLHPTESFMAREHPDVLDIDVRQMPRVQDMTVLGTQVALHKMGQIAAQHRARESWDLFQDPAIVI